MNSDLEDIYQRHLDLWKSHEREYGLRTFVMGAMKEYAQFVLASKIGTSPTSNLIESGSQREAGELPTQYIPTK